MEEGSAIALGPSAVTLSSIGSAARYLPHPWMRPRPRGTFADREAEDALICPRDWRTDFRVRMHYNEITPKATLAWAR